MSNRDLVLNRRHYWLRTKQSAFALVVLVAVSWLAMHPHWSWTVRASVAGSVALAGLFALLVWEVRVMHRNTGFTIFPPGWGSFQPRSGEGSGRFLSLYEFLPYRWRPGGILIGRPLPEQQLLGVFRNAWFGPRDDRHMLTIAGSRSGKGTAALIPNLLIYPGSALVIDPKGELAQITARRRGQGGDRVSEALGQDVFILDPEDIVDGLGGHCWNPLVELVPTNPHVWGHASRIALALVPMSQGGGDTEFFLTNARNMLTALILHVIEEEPPERRNLIYIRQLIMQGDQELFDLIDDECTKTGRANPYRDPHEALLAYLAQSSLHAGKIAGIFRRLVSKADQELSGILGTLDEQTSFLDEYSMQKTLANSDFSLKDLKRRPTTVYVCLRGSKLSGPLAKIVYVMIDLALDMLEQVPGRPPYPVLFAMDEFYCLGRNESLDRAIGLVAGYGITLWAVVQHIGQLKKHYPDTWDNFIRNSRGVQVFGDQDMDTLKWVEQRIGDRVLKRPDGSLDRRPLLSVSDLASYYLNRESRRQLFIPNGKPVAALGLIDYYDGSFPKHWYDDDIRAQQRHLYSAWKEVV